MGFNSKIRRKVNQYLRPTHLYVMARGLLARPHRQASDQDHLLASLQWITRAYHAACGRGIPATYDFRYGLLPSYPETSGYIIDSLLAAFDHFADEAYLDMAVNLARWESAIQLPEGGVRARTESNEIPFVFDTGMVLLGMCSLYQRRPEPWIHRFLTQASSWLVAVQAEDGLWPSRCYKDIPHAYHSKVAWALMRAANVLQDEHLRESARKNLSAVLALKRENGWYDLMAFTRHEPPYTHTIAYMLQGFLGAAEESGDPVLSGTLTGETQMFCGKLLPLLRPSKGPVVFPGEVYPDWQANYSYTCLTGNAQLAGVLLDLARITKQDTYRAAADTLIDSVKSAQDLRNSNLWIRGGIPGSFPIWGRYHPYEYPNWAPKFFIDALLKKMALDSPCVSRTK